MRRRLTALLAMGVLMAAMVVAGAGSAFGQSFDIVERGSGIAEQRSCKASSKICPMSSLRASSA